MHRYTTTLVLLVIVATWAGAAGPAPEAVTPAAAAIPLVGPGPVGPPADPIVLPTGLPKQASFLIDACVQAAMARQDTPGAVVAVIQGGELVYSQGYGVKRRGGTDPMGPDTIFRIGSVTKQLTAAAVMQQVELGAIGLDDPVSLYVPELALGGRWDADALRVRHLLTHTSGYPDNLTEISGSIDEDALSRWAESQDGVELHAPPGSFWNYSNPNFMLAGLVVERASGVPYRSYMEERVFDAAGLARTTFSPAAVLADGDYSWGHSLDPTTGEETIYGPADYDSGAAAPAGWAFSSAGDLASWALLLMDGGGDVLSPDSAAAMQEPLVFVDSSQASWYGYGIFVDLYQGLEVHEHGGNVPGWGTYLLWVPERRDVVVVIANTFSSLNDAAYCILDNVLGTPGDEQVVVDPEPQPWDSLVGEYAGADALGNPYGGRVTAVGGTLWVSLWLSWAPDDHLDVPLVQAYRDTYVIDADGDGVYDLDLSFVASDGRPGRTRWMVNRSLVLEHVTAPRRGWQP